MTSLAPVSFKLDLGKGFDDRNVPYPILEPEEKKVFKAVLIETKDLILASYNHERDEEHYKELFSNPEAFILYGSRKPDSPEGLAKRIERYRARSEGGDPFNAMAVYQKESDGKKTFVAHLVLGGAEVPEEHMELTGATKIEGQKATPGFSEGAYLGNPKYYNKQIASKVMQAVLEHWLPFLAKNEFEVSGKPLEAIYCTRPVFDPEIDDESNEKLKEAFLIRERLHQKMFVAAKELGYELKELPELEKTRHGVRKGAFVVRV